MRDLGGTIHRLGPDTWQWRDGMLDPRVYDLSPDRWHCFGNPKGEDAPFVDVPLATALETAELAWVLRGAGANEFSLIARDGDREIEKVLDLLTTPEPSRENLEELLDLDTAIRVPFSRWRAWCRQNPKGATWDSRYEEDIFTKARRLGWQEDKDGKLYRQDPVHPTVELRRESLRLPPGFIPKLTTP